MDYEKNYFAIREVSERTGIKPVTLRAWQRRYNLVQPLRTEKGHRLYSEEHIALIGEIQSWLNKGVPIGKVKDLLGKTDELGNDVGVGTCELEEVQALLQALSDLNKTKADSIVGNVMKEYPLDVVESQFLQPVYNALSVVRYALRTIQTSLFEGIILSRINAIIESENKAARSGKCLMVSGDPSGSIAARLQALKLCEQGRYIVLLDGVDDFSGFIDHQGLNGYASIALFSSRPWTSAQLTAIEKIGESYEGELSSSTLHDI